MLGRTNRKTERAVLSSRAKLFLRPWWAFLLATAPAAAADLPSFHVGRLVAAPTLDGEVADAEWAGATELDRAFVQVEPERREPSPFRTVVRVAQTDSALYVAVEAFDPDAALVAAAVTDRDGDLDDDDSVAVLLDTFDDDRTAYLFRTNAIATQQDGRIADNGRTVDLLWDGTWRCAARRGDDRWTAELEIPFSSLKFSAGADVTWGVNFLRTVPRRLETSLWSGTAESQWRVSRFGELTGLEIPHQETKRWQAIPYALAVAGDGGELDVEAGGDFRWRPTSSLGVDLTANPDFALVEADVETINLTRFELQIDEKRPFFLEGSELFRQRIRQFFSRRIGDITWGTKVGGKLLGTDFSALVTSEDLHLEDGDLEGGSRSSRADYGVVRFQRSLAGGSNIGLLATNRRLDDENTGSVGLDTTLFFTETLGLTAQLLRVHGPTADGGLAWFVRPAYDSSTTHFHVRYTHLDAGIRDDFNTTGFLRDDDRREADANLTHTFWLDEGPIEKVEAGANYNRFWSQKGTLRSSELDAEVEVVFRNGWELEVEHIDEFKLFEKEFDNDRTVVSVGWDGRDGRSIFASYGTGANFDSDLTLYGLEATWAFGDRWRLSYEVTRLELDPDPEDDTTWIHVFETRYSFGPDLFVKLFVQTNSAIDKDNVQALGVWRFRPPFGSLQLAYQRGTSDFGERSEQGDTFFTKLAWVF